MWLRTHALYWHICAHMGAFFLFLAGWHLSPRHRCPAISAASWLTPWLCFKSASEDAGCPAASYPSHEGQKLPWGNTVQPESAPPFPSTRMARSLLSLPPPTHWPDGSGKATKTTQYLRLPALFFGPGNLPRPPPVVLLHIQVLLPDVVAFTVYASQLISMFCLENLLY